MKRDPRQVQFEAELLASARTDACPTAAEDAWARLERELAGAAAALAPGAGSSLSSVADEVHGSSPSVAAGPPARRARSWAWALIGALLGSAITLLSIWTPVSSPAPRPSVPSPSRAPARQPSPRPQAAVSPLATPPPPPVVQTSPKPVFGPRVKRPRRASALRTQAAGETGGLAAQVALLDRARGALAMGRSGRVLSLVRRFHARFADSSLAADAEVLALEALAMQGAREQLGRRGRRFLEENPYDPHAARVRMLLSAGH